VSPPPEVASQELPPPAQPSPAPTSPEDSESRLGEVEVAVPVVQEELVVTKRPVIKEELRIKRKVVEEEEVIDVDLRKEEVDVEDTSGTARGV